MLKLRIFFVFNELPCGIDQVLEHGVFHSLDNETLAGRIDIFAGNLEHAIFIAQAAQALQLLGSIPGRHVGDSRHALFLQALEDFLNIMDIKYLQK